MGLELYRQQEGRKLRCGYTTGTCAALAAQGAATALLMGVNPQNLALVTPKGVEVRVEPQDWAQGPDWASCAVVKDAGDDADVTHGMKIFARVRKIPQGFVVEGGQGVGRVTKKGLDQPVGAAAINRVPRHMIAQQLEQVAQLANYGGGLEAEISIPGGQQMAAKTFNPNLGIVGGLSVLGTSGIVEPMSLQALLDTIRVELGMHLAQGHRKLLLTPGNYGEDFLARWPGAAQWPLVKCANFIGQSLDMCVEKGYQQVLLVGHIGKLVKLAGGIMDTHSRMADCRAELFAAHAALQGASRQLVAALMEAPTTDQCIALLEEENLREPVLGSLLEKIQYHLEKRVAGSLQVGAVLFSNVYGLLGRTQGGPALPDDRGGN